MRNIALKLMYNGTAYHGWQVQKNAVTVCETLQKAIKDTAGLDLVKAGQYTVGQWLDMWFENYAKLKLRPSSHQTYRGYIDNHIKPNIGHIPLSKLTSQDLQKLV